MSALTRSRTTMILVLLFGFGTAITHAAPPRLTSEADGVRETFNRLRQQHGEKLQMKLDAATGHALMLYGQPIKPQRQPDIENLEVTARDVLRNSERLFGFRELQLELLPNSMRGFTTDSTRSKIGLQFRQVVDGVTVLGSRVSVLMLRTGAVSSILADTTPIPAGFSTWPSQPAESAEVTAREAHEREFGGSSIARAGELVIQPWIDAAGRRTARLAWLVSVTAEPIGKHSPASLYVAVIAADGAHPPVLDRPTMSNEFAVRGRVVGYETEGFGPFVPGAPLLLAPISAARVTADSYCTELNGNTCTKYADCINPKGNGMCPEGEQRMLDTVVDENGDFAFEELADPSQYNNEDAFGCDSTEPIETDERCVHVSLGPELISFSDPREFRTAVVFDLTETFLFNEVASEVETAEVNAYLWVTRTRQWILEHQQQPLWDPFDGVQIRIEANLGIADVPPCSAFHSPSSGLHVLKFAKSEDDGPCQNMAFSTIVVHETGHAINWEVLGGANPTHPIYSEGLADVWAAYVTNYPKLGEGHGVLIDERDAENDIQFGEGVAHCDEIESTINACPGQVLLGAMWKVKENFQARYGEDAGRQKAGELLVDWQTMMPWNGEIEGAIEDLLLLVDDDDGDLSNGTPNYFEIDDAFRRQGFPGVDLLEPVMFVEFQPASGDPRIAIAVVDEQPAAVSFYFDETAGRFEERSGNGCGSDVLDNPGFVEITFDTQGHWIDSCDGQTASGAFTCDEFLLGWINTGQPITINTDRYQSEPSIEGCPWDTSMLLHAPGEARIAEITFRSNSGTNQQREFYRGVVLERQLMAAAVTNPPAMAETGIISLDEAGITVSLLNVYANPVVFMQPLGDTGGDTDPATVRIVSVGHDEFRAEVQEPSNGDGDHTVEWANYWVVESGRWRLPNGTLLEAGVTAMNSQIGPAVSNSWETMSFGSAFDATPVVLSQVQSNSNPELVVTRQKAANASSVKLALQQEEGALGAHGTEMVGWLAIEPVSGTWGGRTFSAGSTSSVVSDKWKEIQWPAVNNANFVASLGTTNGADSGWIRRKSLSSTSVKVRVEEDTTKDAETAHIQEDVNYLLINGYLSLNAWRED